MSMYVYYSVTMQRIDAQTGAITPLPEEETTQIIAELIEQSPEMADRIDEDGRGTNDEGGFWDEEEQFMTEFSKRYPHVLFNIDRDVHSAGERGDSYYLNGKSQDREAHWEYEPINLRKLGVLDPPAATVADEIGSALTIFRWLQIYKMYLSENGLDDDTADISVNNLAEFVKQQIPSEDFAAYENRISTTKWKP